jgi:glycosyltransferase involved in cell wall biosynthesis
MRILQIHKTFHPTGGADTFFFKTCDLLTENGHEVAHFSTKHPKNRPSPFSSYFVDGFTNEEVSDLGSARKVKAFFNGIYSSEARKNLAQLVADFKPDLAHAHSINYQLSPSIFDVFRDSGIPLVVTLHDYHIICGAGTLFVDGAVCERCRGGRHHNLLRHNCYWNLPASVMAMLSHYLQDARHSWDVAARLLAPSRFLLDKLVEFGISEERIAHVPIFIDYSEEPKEHKGGVEYVLYFGRLAPNKGVEVLLEAVKTLGCELMLIGDGPSAAWVEEQCAVRKNVKRLAFVSSREELRRYIEGAAFSVIPSVWYENQPATVLETYAMSRPVIGSRMGGIPELIDDGETGLLFEAGNAADLAEKMRFLLDRPELCREWGRNGQRKLRKEFSRESHYGRLMEIYGSVLNADKTPERVLAQAG